MKKLLGRFTKKNYKKTTTTTTTTTKNNQIEFKIEKVIREKVINYI